VEANLAVAARRHQVQKAPPVLAGEGWSIQVRLDEDALKVIADLTRAEYFFAGNAPYLKRI
jgi:hypothetical protein